MIAAMNSSVVVVFMGPNLRSSGMREQKQEGRRSSEGKHTGRKHQACVSDTWAFPFQAEHHQCGRRERSRLQSASYE